MPATSAFSRKTPPSRLNAELTPILSSASRRKRTDSRQLEQSAVKTCAAESGLKQLLFVKVSYASGGFGIERYPGHGTPALRKLTTSGVRCIASLYVQ